MAELCNINAFWVIFVFLFSWFSVMTGVAMGGYLVFRASNSGGGPLFRFKSDTPAGATNIDDGFEREDMDNYGEEVDPLGDLVSGFNDKFKAAFRQEAGAEEPEEKKESSISEDVNGDKTTG